MFKPYDFCPKCQRIREMTVSISLKKIVDPPEEYEVLIFNYHCDTCLTFIRSVAQEELENVEVLSRM